MKVNTLFVFFSRSFFSFSFFIFYGDFLFKTVFSSCNCVCTVEPSGGVDSEALDVAKDCLIEVFKIDRSSLDSQSNCDSLVEIFSASEANLRHVVDHEGVSNAPPTSSLGKNVEVTKVSLLISPITFATLCVTQ